MTKLQKLDKSTAKEWNSLTKRINKQSKSDKSKKEYIEFNMSTWVGKLEEIKL